MKKLGVPGGGRVLPSTIGRQQAVADVEGAAGARRGGQERDHLRRRVAGHELRPVDRIGAHALEGAARAQELARADVERVGPDAVLGVVGEVPAGREGVAEVGAQGVGRLGDGHAVEEGRPRGGELAQDPTVGELVVEHDRVAAVVGLAVAPEAGPQGVVGRGSEQQRAGLAVDGERQVGHGHVVARADIADRVGRLDTGRVAGSVERDERARDLARAELVLDARVLVLRAQRSFAARVAVLELVAVAPGLRGQRRDRAQRR